MASDRPGFGPLWVVSAAVVATLGGAVLWLVVGEPLDNPTPAVALLIGAPLVGLGVAIEFWLLNRPSLDDVRGIGAIVLVVAAIAAGVASLARPADGTAVSVQVLVVVGLAAAAAAITAFDWSPRWFLGTVVVVVSLCAILLVQVGFRVERSRAVADRITDATTELEALKTTAEEGAAAKNAELDGESTTARGTLEGALPFASEAFRTAGRDVLTAIVRAGEPDEEAPDDDAEDVDDDSETAADPTPASGLALLLALPFSAGSTPQDMAVRDAAEAAVAASAAAEKGASAPSTEKVDGAKSQACAVAAQAEVEVEACPEPDEGDPTPTEVDPVLALRQLDVEMVLYRAAVDTEDEALAAAATAAASAEPEPLEVSLLAALAAGPGAVVDSTGLGEPLRFVPGPFGWALLGVALALGLRKLAQVNALQLPGPVDVSYEGDHNADLRIAILRNLKAPGASPGAAVAQSVTDLTALAGTQAAGVGKVVAAISPLLSFERGYVVEADLATPPAKDEKDSAASKTEADGGSEDATAKEPTTVLVRVSAAGSKESLGSRAFSDVAPEKTMRAAGLWAAAFLLGRSTRIPSWATWTEQTARALEATTSEDPTLDELAAAARAAPTSGWILQLYGNALELAGRNLEAIEMYARAVAVHPRYLVARYRLAVALGMLGRDTSIWETAPLAQRAAVRKMLEEVGERLSSKPEDANAFTGPLTTVTDFHRLAVTLLKSVEDDSQRLRHLSGQLRRADRDQGWLKWRGRRTSRVNTFWLAKSAQLAYLATEDEILVAAVAAVARQAQKRSTTWQVSYNLACHYATTPTEAPALDVALDWLERCLRRPGAQQIDVAWVQRDADLESLQGHPRFVRFCDALRDGSTP